MRIRSLITTVVATVVLSHAITAVPVAAQHHPLGWAGFGAPGWMSTVDPNGGSWTTLRALSPFQGIVSGTGLTTDIDNRTFVVSLYGIGPAVPQVVRIDAQGVVVGTVVPQLGRAREVIVDQNGDYAFLSQTDLIRVDRATSRQTTIAAVVGNGLVTDVNNGDFIVSTAGSAQGATLVRITPGGATTTIASLPTLATSWQIAQSIPTGDVYVTGTTVPLVAVLPGGAVLTVSGVTRPLGGIAADRASAASPRLIGTVYGGLYGFQFVDVRTHTITETSPSVTHRLGPITPLRARNIATRRVAPGVWDVLFSFPGEASKAWTCALSLGGISPRPLPDGRQLLIKADALVVASLNGALAPFFRGHAGLLDGNGDGRGRIDVSSLSGVSGVRVWIQALTLDSAAPLGIRSIADPVLLVL